MCVYTYVYYVNEFINRVVLIGISRLEKLLLVRCRFTICEELRVYYVR